MALSLIQKTGDFVSASDTLNITVNATGSNNLIIVLTAQTSAENILQVTDNATGGSSQYVQVPSSVATYEAGSKITEIWYAKQSRSGATTITITTTNPPNLLNGWIFEVSGADITDTVHKVGVVNNGSSDTPLGGSVTTTIANTFIASVIQTEATTTGMHAGNEFTLGNIVNGNASAYLIANTAAAHTPQWDTDAVGNFCSSTAAFKIAEAAALMMFMT